MIEQFRLIRNVGRFRQAVAGNLALRSLTLIYAENGRGKTTLTSILRSLKDGMSKPILDRRRLGTTDDVRVVIVEAGKTHIFENGSWNSALDSLVIFDDEFVSNNVCSGLEIGVSQRQNLHELILGAQGVALNKALNDSILEIETVNRSLRSAGEKLSERTRAQLGPVEFASLQPDDGVAEKIEDVERRLSAARAQSNILAAALLSELALPVIPTKEIVAILERDLPDISEIAAVQLQLHLKKLGGHGESFLAQGTLLVRERNLSSCPYCDQSLETSAIAHLFQHFFTEAYDELVGECRRINQRILDQGAFIGGFHREYAALQRDYLFWQRYLRHYDLSFDTERISNLYDAATRAIFALMEAKARNPSARMKLSDEVQHKIASYNEALVELAKFNEAIQEMNRRINLVKESVQSVDIELLTEELSRYRMVANRSTPEAQKEVDEFKIVTSAKKEIEDRRDAARAELDRYRLEVFPRYEDKMNSYLQRLNAGFRVQSVQSVNNRGGSTASYAVLIGSSSVPLTASDGPSFRNTLSGGDRNALALAFFFAALDIDSSIRSKIVVFDDPVTSLDDHRSLATIQEILLLRSKVEQVIVLSHAKSFLARIWDNADKAFCAAVKIWRNSDASEIDAWDANNDLITEHDRRNERVRAYLNTHDSAQERAVAADLRPMLEAFMRVAYPHAYPPGTLLGPFIYECKAKLGTDEQLLNAADIGELRQILDYANRFHHDTNSAYMTEIINDAELTHFAERTLRFIRRT